jgi:hypothetical protein
MRKLLTVIFLTVIFLFNTLPVSAVSNDDNIIQIDTTSIQNGVVKITLKTGKDNTYRLVVEKGNQRMTYYLNNDGTVESFPLQAGNGDYKVSILENVEGNKYRYLKSETFELNLKDSKLVYLNSVQNIPWNEDSTAVKIAAKLTKNMTKDKDKINAIYNYIVNNIQYDYNKHSGLKSDYNPDPEATLKSGSGICYDYSSTLAVMLRSVGVPTKLVKGYSENAIGFHAWNQVYDSETGKWITIDATVDSQLKASKVSYSMVKADDLYTVSYYY